MSEKKRCISNETILSSSFGSCHTLSSFSSSESLCELDKEPEDDVKKKKNNYVKDISNNKIKKRRPRESHENSKSPQIKDILKLLIKRNTSPFSPISKDNK